MALVLSTRVKGQYLPNTITGHYIMITPQPQGVFDSITDNFFWNMLAV